MIRHDPAHLIHHLVGEMMPELEHLYAGACAVTAKRLPQIIGDLALRRISAL